MITEILDSLTENYENFLTALKDHGRLTDAQFLLILQILKIFIILNSKI